MDCGFCIKPSATSKLRRCKILTAIFNTILESLAIKHLYVQHIAMGLTTPPFLLRATKEAPKRNCLTGEGVLQVRT